MKQFQVLNLLLCLGLFFQRVYADFIFSHPQSTVNVTNARFFINNPITNWNGTLCQSGNIFGQSISFDQGYLKREGTAVLLSGVYDTSNSILAMTQNQSVCIDNGRISNGIIVYRSGNRLEGLPVFNQNASINLVNNLSGVTFATHGLLNANIALNGGNILLDQNLQMVDGKVITGSGTIGLQGRKFFFAGSNSEVSLNLTHTIFWNSAGEINLTGPVALSGQWTIDCPLRANPGPGDGGLTTGYTRINGNGNLLDLSLRGTINVLSGTTLHLSNIKIKGLGRGGFSLASHTSQIRLSNVEIELANSYTMTSGGIYVQGQSIIETKSNIFTLSNRASLTVDGITLWYDPGTGSDLFNIQPNVGSVKNSGGNKFITYLNSGSIRGISDSNLLRTTSNALLYMNKTNSNAIVALNTTVRTYSNAFTRGIRNNSNALLFGDRANSNALIAQGTSLNSSITTINTTLRTHSNAFTRGIRNNSNALLFGDRANSNALLAQGTSLNSSINTINTTLRTNSNAVLYANRTTSNALLAQGASLNSSINTLNTTVRTYSNAFTQGIRNNSNALLFGDRANSNALLAQGTSLNNSITTINTTLRTNSNSVLYGNRTTSNALLYVNRTNSNAIVTLNTTVRTYSNAFTRGIRNNSNALLRVSKNNSNAIVCILSQLAEQNSPSYLAQLIRINSNALMYLTTNNSNSILTGLRTNSNAFLSCCSNAINYLSSSLRVYSNAFLSNIRNNSNALLFGDRANSNALLAQGTSLNSSLNTLNTTVRTHSNAFTRWIRDNSNALLFGDRANSNALLAQGTLLNNSITTINTTLRTNSNAVLYGDRTNSNAIVTLNTTVRTYSNAFTRGIRNNSNALLFGDRANSNALLSQGTSLNNSINTLNTTVRTYSNAFTRGIRNNSNALLFGDRANSNALLAQGTSLNNSITTINTTLRTHSNAFTRGIRNNSNTLIRVSRNNSNAIMCILSQLAEQNSPSYLAQLIRINSNALMYLTTNNSNSIITGLRTNSNALLSCCSNAINYLSSSLRVYSNAFLSNIRNNSNALLFGDRANSNALLAQGTSLNNSITTINTTLRTNSNAVLYANRTTSNALLFGDKTNSNALLAQGTSLNNSINTINTTLRTYSNSFTRGMRNNSNALLFGDRTNSNALLAQGTSLNNSITTINTTLRTNSNAVLYANRTTSNALLYVNRTSSNTIQFLSTSDMSTIRVTSNALLYVARTLSNALMYGDRVNSNTIISFSISDQLLARTTSNSLLFCCKNMSNSIMYGNRTFSNAFVQGIRSNSNALLFGDRTNSNALLSGNGGCSLTLASLVQDVSVGADCFILADEFIGIQESITIDGQGSGITFAHADIPQFVVAPNTTVTLKNINLLRINKNTFSLGQNAKLLIDHNVIFELSEDVSLLNQYIRVLGDQNSPNVFTIRGNGGLRRWNLIPVYQPTSAGPQIITSFDIGLATVQLENVEFTGLESVQASQISIPNIGVFTGAFALSSYVIMNINSDSGVSFIVGGPGNILRLLNNNITLSGYINYNQLFDGELHIQFNLPQRLTTPPQLNLGDNVLFLGSTEGYANLILDDYSASLNLLGSNSFVTGDNAYLGGQFLNITSNPIKQTSKTLTIGSLLHLSTPLTNAIDSSFIRSAKANMRSNGVYTALDLLQIRALNDLDHERALMHKKLGVKQHAQPRRKDDPFEKVRALGLESKDDYELGSEIRLFTIPTTTDLSIYGSEVKLNAAQGVIDVAHGGIVDFGINDKTSLMLYLSGDAVVSQGSSDVTFKSSDSLFVSGANNLVHVTNTVIFDGPINMNEATHLVFEFDDNAVNPMIVFRSQYNSTLQIPKNSRIEFRGNGTVWFQDGMIISLNGLAGSQSSFVVSDSAIMSLGSQSSAIAVGSSKINLVGVGEVIFDNAAQCRIESDQQIIVGQGVGNDILFKASRDALISIDAIRQHPQKNSATLSFQKGAYSLEFAQGGGIYIGSQGVLEINALNGQKKPGLLKKFDISDGGNVEVSHDGTFIMGSNALINSTGNEVPFVFTTLLGSFVGDGVIQLAQTGFAGRFKNTFVRSRPGSSVTGSGQSLTAQSFVRLFINQVPTLNFSTVFLDAQGNKKLLNKNIDIYRLDSGQNHKSILSLAVGDEITSDSPTTGNVYGMNKGARFTILQDGSRIW